MISVSSTASAAITPAPEVGADQRSIYGYGADRGWMVNLRHRLIEFGNHQSGVIVRVRFDESDTFAGAEVDGDGPAEHLSDLGETLRVLEDSQPR